jgi:hypothetical protein
MGADAQAGVIAEGLKRKSECDHLSEEIVEPDDGAAIRAYFEVLTQTHAIFCEPPLAFRVRRARLGERLEHQSKGFAKRVRVALAAAAALKRDASLTLAVDQHVVPGTTRPQVENERPLGLAGVADTRSRSAYPPLRCHLETEVGGSAIEALDLNAKVGHHELEKGGLRNGLTDPTVRPNASPAERWAKKTQGKRAVPARPAPG